MTNTNSSTNKNTSFFMNMNVRSKIISGFAAMIAVLFIVSGLGYVGFVNVNKEVDEYAVVVEEAALVSSIEVEFLKLQNYAVDSSIRVRKKMLKKYNVWQLSCYPRLTMLLQG